MWPPADRFAALPAARRDAPRRSLAGTLDRSASYLSPALVSPPAYQLVQALARELPAAITSRMYFECRLDPCAQVDVVIALYRPEAELLARDYAGTTLRAAVRAHPVWSRLRAFCADWLSGQPSLQPIDHFWLEFDVEAGRAGDVPVPCVGLSFGELRPPGFSVESWLRWASAGLIALTGQPVTAATMANLTRALAALPPAAYLPYVGIMFSRADAGVRLCLSNIASADLPDYLRAIAWPGDTDRLRRDLSEVAAARAGAARPDVGMVHVDVGPIGIGPRLGLEYYFERFVQFSNRLDEHRFLDWLVRRGCCEQAKRDGLDTWPGSSLETLPHELWVSRLVRRVNHVKLVWQQGQPLSAKAYLFAAHRRVRPRAAGPSTGAS